MTKPSLLWIDCTSGLPDPEHRIRCAAEFEVTHACDIDRAPQEITRHKPAALCFDFDYPDQQRLHAMRVIKQSFPRLPILMLTLEHSETLAVWAFRARVWNYLTKPVAAAELSENLRALASLCHRSSPPREARLVTSSIPNGLRDVPLAADVARLQPAVNYVAQHYHERVSAGAAAKACGLSRFDFSRRFRTAFGMTFRDYLLRVRIAEARRLLTAGTISVTGVAYSVGFNDGSHFARMFKRVTGVLPSGYCESDLARDQPRRRRASDRVDSVLATA